MRVLHEEAMSLAEAISIMSDNSLMCFGKIEDLMAERLLDNARILERMDYEGRLSEGILTDIAEQNDIYRIDVFGRDGRKVLSSQSQEDSDQSDSRSLIGRIAPLLDGIEDEMIIGLEEGEGERFVAGVRRRRGGAIVLNLDTEEILNLRKSMGIGDLIQDIGENEIVYRSTGDGAGDKD